MHILHHKRIIEVIQNIQPRTVYLTHNPLIIKYIVQKYSSLTKMPILLTLLHIFAIEIVRLISKYAIPLL